jgi:acetyl esterase/lipase
VSLAVRIALSALSRPARHSYGEDPSQVADLHLPRGDGPFPVAVLLHGGYWQTRYGKLIMRPLAADLARRGWAAWNLEYRRLGTGRGGGGGWPQTFDDVAAGIDALAPVSDLAAAGATARALLGGRPEEVPERYALADPIRRAPLGVPVLVVHPADDATVPVARSRAYAAAARAGGGEVELRDRDRGGHRTPIDPGSDAWRAAAEWLAAAG